MVDQYSNIKGILTGLNKSQWLQESEIEQGQIAQSLMILKWAIENCPHYKNLEEHYFRLKELEKLPKFWDEWRRLPILTKQELRDQGQNLKALSISDDQEPVSVIHTSGSTGIPVEIHKGSPSQNMFRAMTLREHFWHQRDFTQKLGVVRYRSRKRRARDGMIFQSWGPPVSDFFHSGTSSVLHVGRPINEIIEWLHKFNPHYLLTYPSIAKALVDKKILI